jgi:NTP pyrophosphatase (non-canonical NTP hydrolase)
MAAVPKAVTIKVDTELVEFGKLIVEWGERRNLIKGSSSKDQFCKLMQECGELSDSICKGINPKDDIGDCLVVLTLIAAQYNLSLNECAFHAYEEIKDRKGRMVDGVFVKEE